MADKYFLKMNPGRIRFPFESNIKDIRETTAMANLFLKEVNRLGTFAVYDPLHFWGGTVYQKGAWIVHMLRWQLGDDRFFSTLQRYLKQYSYQNVTTLEWFFAQWIYQPGHPDLDLSWNIENEKSTNYKVILSIRQRQEQPVYILPIEVSITTGSVLDTILIDEREKQFYFQMTNRPLELILDPNNWVLKVFDVISTPSPDHFLPGEFALGDSYPNPFLANINGSSVRINIQIGTGKISQKNVIIDSLSGVYS